MKKYIFSLAILFFILVSCGSSSQQNSGNQTHTHRDGTTHSHHDCDHNHDDIPDGQESFEVGEEEDSRQHNYDHNHDHSHEHPHKH